MNKNTKKICVRDRDVAAKKAQTVKGGAFDSFQVNPSQQKVLIGLLLPAVKKAL